MEQFSGRGFYLLGQLLERVAEVHRRCHPTAETFVFGPTVSGMLSEQRAVSLQGFMKEVSQRCAELGLQVATSQANYIHQNAQTLTNEQVASNLEHLDRTIQFEMGKHLFFFIAPMRAEYYDKLDLLGYGVLGKFSDVHYDIVEAGNCFAVGRSTAVVFHLMRIMEIGVQAFGTKLGVPLANEKNWQNILDEINKAIKALPKSSQAVQMAQAAANLYAVKLAWRNEVMHPNDTYTLEEAENLIRLVKIFMEELATVV